LRKWFVQISPGLRQKKLSFAIIYVPNLEIYKPKRFSEGKQQKMIMTVKSSLELGKRGNQ